MNNEFERKLWEKAQENAKTFYEEEWGKGTWNEQLDKYEKEDYVWAEYERLKMEIKDMAQMRDEKGRFVSTKTNEYGNNVTTNNTTNKKENDTMMNKTNAKDNRMETLKANGIDTTNFFDLSMRVPFGAEVKIIVDGKEMIIPATNCKESFVTGGILHNASISSDLYISNDPIAQSIVNDGYVKNSHLFRRWIFAKTMQMINYKSYRNPNRTGWEACMKDCYSYQYQFDMMIDELHTLAKLQKEDPEYFAERTMFFNGDVVVALLNDYLYRLKKYVKKQMKEHPRTCRGAAYVKLAKYGNVLVKDLNDKVYIPIKERINVVESMVKANNYTYIEREFKIFMDKFYNKLPYETTKCSQWKDAFKGAGAFYSLQNAIRFHKVLLRGCGNKYESEAMLNDLLKDDYRNEVWRFHQLLIDTIEYNKFDLKKSIAYGNAAPNTTSWATRRYAR